MTNNSIIDPKDIKDLKITVEHDGYVNSCRPDIRVDTRVASFLIEAEKLGFGFDGNTWDQITDYNFEFSSRDPKTKTEIILTINAHDKDLVKRLSELCTKKSLKVKVYLEDDE